MKTNRILVLLSAAALTWTGFAQMGGSRLQNANGAPGMSSSNMITGGGTMETNSLAWTNMMSGAISGTNMIGDVMSGTNMMSGVMSGTNMMSGVMSGTNMFQMGGMANPHDWANHDQVLAPNSTQNSMSSVLRTSGGQAGFPSDMQSMMKRFQADRDAFITKQKTVETQLKGATEEQRQTLMMQMQGQMQEWKEQHAMMRQQMLQQVGHMKEQMMEQQRLLNHVATPGQGSPQGGGKPGRPTGMGSH